MSYTPTEWATGDVITAEKLNNMENGIVGSAKVVFVEWDDDTGAMSKTWSEINSALSDGVLCLYISSDSSGTGVDIITGAIRVQNGYGIWTGFSPLGSSDPVAIADTPDDYPVAVE